MGFFEPDWKSNNEQKALLALEEVKGDQALLEVALEARCESVRLTAVSRIESEDVLKKIALEMGFRLYTDEHPVPVAAAERLIGQEALAEVYLGARYSDVAQAAGTRFASLYPDAFPQLKQQREEMREDELYRIVTESDDSTQRLMAVLETQRDETVVAALEDKSNKVCVAAIEKVKDHAAFVSWLRSGRREAPIDAPQLYEKIETLTASELLELAEDENVNTFVRGHARKLLDNTEG